MKITIVLEADTTSIEKVRIPTKGFLFEAAKEAQKQSVDFMNAFMAEGSLLFQGTSVTVEGK